MSADCGARCKAVPMPLTSARGGPPNACLLIWARRTLAAKPCETVPAPPLWSPRSARPKHNTSRTQAKPEAGQGKSANITQTKRLHNTNKILSSA
eukprot:15459664-Alexandrium_andersonii.AAC.1